MRIKKKESIELFYIVDIKKSNLEENLVNRSIKLTKTHGDVAHLVGASNKPQCAFGRKSSKL